jgi:hypothetical protein
LDGQFAVTAATLSFDSDARLCLRYLVGPDQDTCVLQGRYWLSDSEGGFFDFELRRTDGDGASALPFRGKGWLQNDSDGDAIVLVGNNGYVGLGLIAR